MLYTNSLNAITISEIIDDGHNKSVFIYENHNIYEKIFLERGLKAYTNLLNKKEIDAVFICLDLSKSLIDDHLICIKNILRRVNIEKKIYVIITNNKKSKGLIYNLKSYLMIKKAKIKIKNLLYKELNLYKYTSQNILFNNNKIQAILPFFLLKKYYKRPWRFSISILYNCKLKVIKYILVKFLPINLFNDSLLVFKCDR